MRSFLLTDTAKPMNDWPVYIQPIRDVPRPPRSQTPDGLSAADASTLQMRRGNGASTQPNAHTRLSHPDLRDAVRNLTMVRAGLSTALRRCDAFLAPPNASTQGSADALTTNLLRDVLHLRARIEGLQAGTDDALSVLTRITKRGEG